MKPNSKSNVEMTYHELQLLEMCIGYTVCILREEKSEYSAKLTLRLLKLT
jgi:hypothetical protein